MHNDNPADPAPTQDLVVPGRSVPQSIVHSWARDGRMFSAWPGDGTVVPHDGTRIGVKIINFPIGSVREIWLDTGARTHPHDSHEDVLFYQISGRRVQMCEADCGLVNAGDVSFEPHGVEHSTYQLIGGLFVEFALPAPRRVNGSGLWTTAAQAHCVTSAVWREGDHIMGVDGADAWWAPPYAGRHQRRFFCFPGHELVETTLPGGAQTAPRTEAHDTLFYVVAGHVAVTIGEFAAEVEAGDSLRAPAGQSHAFTAMTDSCIIQAAARAL